jgi:uncharacterized membrane protein
MRALDRISPDAAVAAMASINRVILRSAFMPLFLARSASALTLAVLALFHREGLETMLMAAGGTIYVLGMFVCTIAFNLPLNDELEEADTTSSKTGAAWAGYRRDWARWNHLRAASAVIATACFIAALSVA